MPLMNSRLTNSEKRAVLKYHDDNKIYIAQVMDTRAPLKNGDLKVWILNSGNERENPKNWVIAHPANGCNNVLNFNKVGNLYNTQETSFGVWNTIPYIGNYVFIFYPCSVDSTSTAYWFGSPSYYNNLMIPGIPYDLTQTTNLEAKFENNYHGNTVEKGSIYTPLQNGLELQGLDKDRLRGVSTASTFRDTPSHCYGFLSPLGNQMVIDDGWSKGDSNINWINDPRSNDNDNSNKDDYGVYHSKKEWIASISESDKDNKLNRFHGGFRFRTRNGTQLLILDCGNIYMINKDGTAWMELSDDGYIDCYSAFGINAASDGDINLHAPNINIEADETITLNAKKSIILNSSGNINANSNVLAVSKKISTPSLDAGAGIINSITSGAANMTGIFAGTLQGTALYATSAGTLPIEQPLPSLSSAEISEVEYPTYYDVEQEVNNDTITSINTRVPSHEPWAGHDKNNCIPDLIIKQVLKKEEIEPVNNVVEPNQIK